MSTFWTLFAFYLFGLPWARSESVDRPFREVWQRVMFWPIFAAYLWCGLIAMAVSPRYRAKIHREASR